MLGPGSDPTVAVHELVGSGFVGTVVIDQLDEILAASGPDERQALISALVENSRWWAIAVTIREDHLADIADEPALARLLERGTYILGPITDDGMRDAIVRPAAEAALVLEPGLVDLLLREVTGAPGALPLMAHALHQTWERREGRTLTVDGYHASGGISGAVAQTAERVYEDLSVAVGTRCGTSSSGSSPWHPTAPRCVSGPPCSSWARWRARTSSRCSSEHGCSAGTTVSWRWRTSPSPGSGPGCRGGSRTTSRAGASCATSRMRPRAGRRWAGSTASCTEGSG